MLNTNNLQHQAEADDESDAILDITKLKKPPLTNDEIMSNSVVFMLAGYDTTSSALSFASYLLATNQHCQGTLIHEIDTNLGKDPANYDNVMKLPYLDRVFRETLRVCPTATRFGRKAVCDTTVKGIRIPAGTVVYFPIYAIHHDPEIWSDPEVFDPDRFLPENKTALHDYSWVPFGIGPRNCIALRLTFLEFNMALVTILQNFRFRTAPDTEIPLKLEKGEFVRALNVAKNDMEMVKKYGRVYGFFHARYPVLIVAEPEMIKEICVKSFLNFINRPMPEPMNKVFTSAVSTVSDDHWKFSRNVLSPTFSSGKMRQMVVLIQKCTDNLVKNLKRISKDGTSVEMKKTMGCYTMDAIASTGFGMDVDSQTDENNVFVKNAEEAMLFGFPFSFLVVLLFPFMKRVFEAMNISFMPNRPRNFFFGIMNDVIKDRRSNPSDRPDLLQLMLNTHNLEHQAEADDEPDAILDFTKLKKRPLTNDEIMSNSVVFMLAGYDTTSSALSFASYLLATNQHCQETLIHEIDTNLGKDQANYDNVMKLPYLDRVFRETLRIFPPTTRFRRKAAEDITVKGIRIPAGTAVNFPIYAIHHDPEIWSDPEVFDPDRFVPENKTALHDYSWVPFGVGPRNCIGMRLAFLEFKMALVTILQNFRFRTAPDTEIPPKLEKGAFVRALNGIYLRLEERN